MKGLLHLYFVLCFLLILSFNSSAPTQLCPPDQSLALIQFNNSLSINCSAVSFSCSEGKVKTITWKEGTSCCLWDGVRCENETGNVIGLDLRCNCIYGTIPSNSTLFLLHHLQELNLAYNDLTGTIPFEISHLSKLLSLDLSYNCDLNFEGYVFEKVLGNLTQLQHLLLRGVNMSSVVPTSFLNMSSSIINLSLNSNRLKGKFPVDVFRFPCLQNFMLCNNDVEVNFPKSNWSAPLLSLEVFGISSLGDLPDSIGNLRFLELLDLSNSHLKGSIPVTVGNLTQLILLKLSLNSITGPILFSFSNFKQLSYIDLFQNNLVGPIIDSFGNLTQLSALSLGYNQFSGPLPFSAFNLPQIGLLDFSGNKFVGPLPNHVSGHSQLDGLYLQSNFVSGRIPSWLFSLPHLVLLDLSNNKLTGPIEQFDKVAPLQAVYLQNNEIHGLFELYKNLSILQELNLSNNSFISLTSGGNDNYSWPSLGLLNLSSCNIIEVPDVVRNLPGLTILDLSHNRIRVMEAQMFSNLESLGILDLSHNIGLSFSNDSLVLPSLMELYLSSCNITQFPNFLTSLDRLISLDLSNNLIQGKLSKEEIKWGKNLLTLDLSQNLLTVLEGYPWRTISYLQLGSNQLEGPFLVPPPSTNFLSISKNKLVGEIPSSICNSVWIEILDLSNNNLSGAIPECLNSGVMNLSVLDLSNNKFTGNIPNIFPKGNMLRTIQLNNNDFDGPLPKSLVNCVELEVLNLGNNKINDTFPHWLGTLPQLQVLVLHANHFHGQLIHSEKESHFSSLRILDLSHNELSGSLSTSYFKSFKSMMNLSGVGVGYMWNDKYYRDSVVVTIKGVEIELERILTIFTTIDMSSNKFEGKFPETIGKLISLQVLNFSHNKLTGHIPSSFGNLAALESLDLSSNKIGGKIPMQLVSLNFLEVLNLSQNQLVGEIPQGKQFNTFLNDSYEGNLGLCGFPLPKRCGPDEPPAPPVFHEGSDSAFGLDWKFVLMGYGCGLVCGISAGYIMLTLQKPRWLVNRVQLFGNKVLRRLKRYH
ncbi:hypothetical protein PTKIN_Ptkin14bG0174900 [Pterospermum kingtungense]